MPFNPQATYQGGAYLQQGLASIGQGIGGAIQQYQDISDQATKSDALMNYLSQQVDPVTNKPIIDPKTLQAYQQHSSRQRAFVAGGLQAGMTLADALTKLGYANREQLARTNLYQAQAEEARGAGTTTTSVVTNPVTGEKVPVMQTGKGQPQIMGTNTIGAIAYDEQGNRIGVWGPGNRIIRDRAPNAFEALFPGAFGGGTQPAEQPQAAAGTPPPLLTRPQDQTAAAPATAAAPGASRGAPQVGEQRIIQGQLAVWDGTGWKAAGG